MTNIRLEVWDRLGTAGFEKKIATLDTLSDSARLQPVNGVGEGRASLPDYFDRAGTVLHTDPANPANNVRSLVRAYLDGDVSGVDPPYVEWLPDQIVPPQDSESGQFEISGLGREAMVRDAVVEPWDWDGNAEWLSTWPDWIYGGKDIVGPVETTFAPAINAVWIDAGATGTATIDIDLDGGGFQSATVAPGDSAFDVEQAIEALAYGITADVEGSGTIANPWQIKLLDPAGTYVVAISSSGLSGGRIYTNQEQFGSLLPVGWTESRVGSTTIGHGILTDFRASLGGGADPTLPAGCDTWVVFLGQEWYFPGVQTIRRVIPGGVYFLPPVWLYAQGAAADVRVVVRDLNEQLLAQEEVSLASNTLTQSTGVWTGPAVVGGTGTMIIIPEGVYEIVYRLGHIGAGTPPRIFLGCPSMTEGFPASNIGVIVGDLYTDWTANHAASPFPLSYWVHGDGGFYLALDFDGTNDSANNPWPRDEEITIKRGERFDKVLGKIVGLGYEWRVVPGPVDGYYLLQIFTAPTLGTDFSALDTPTIRGGRDVARRSLRRWLSKTGSLVEGAAQFFAHATNTAARSTWGVSSDYSVRLDFEEGPTAVAAAERVSDQLRKTRSLVINLTDTNQATNPIPGRDYVAGDTIRVLDPPLIVDDPERVWSILYSQDAQGLTWEVQLGNQSFADTGGGGAAAGVGAGKGAVSRPMAEAVRYLMEAQELVRAPAREPLPTPITSGNGGAPTVVVSAADSTQYSIDRADFKCTGINDEGTINLAIQAANRTGYGGRVVLCEGTFFIEVPAAGGSAIRLLDGTQLFGMLGFPASLRGTVLYCVNTGTPSAVAYVVEMDNETSVRDLLVDTTSPTGNVAGIRTAAGSFIDGCVLLPSADAGILIRASVCRISNTHIVSSDTTDPLIASENTATNKFEVQIVDCRFEAGAVGVDLTIGSGNTGDARIDQNLFDQIGGTAIALDNDGCMVRGNQIFGVGGHGVHLNNVSNGIVADNIINEPGQNTNNTFDGIFVEGGSDRNSIQTNRIISSGGTQARYGVNIAAGTDNVVNANVIGPSGDFGTGVTNGTFQGTNFTV